MYIHMYTCVNSMYAYIRNAVNIVYYGAFLILY